MTQGRIDDLDIVRAIALFGLLPMNILSFANPVAAYLNPSVMFGDQWSTYVSHFMTFVFFDQKMMGLFSLLFGTSMMLLVSKHQSKGVSPAKQHYKRYLWLLGFGILHLSFIWMGDILHIYALCAFVAFPLLRLPAKMLIGLAALLWVIVIVSYLNLHAQLGAIDFTIVANEAASYNPSAEAIATEIEAYRSDYWSMLGYFFGEDTIYKSLADSLILNVFYLTGFLRALAMMLLGAGLYQLNFWIRPITLSTQRGAVALLVAGVAMAVVGFSVNHSQHWQTSVMALGIVFNQLATPLLVIGYALAIRVLLATSWRSLLMRLAPVGRMAFTLYIGQSVLMTALFYGWGLGLFGALDRPMLWLVTAITWLVMFGVAHGWFTRFHQGPLEALWRRLSR